ncbi:hypothetical protein HDU76_010313, partial [Blyttiomyces sp. JEL0837]
MSAVQGASGRSRAGADEIVEMTVNEQPQKPERTTKPMPRAMESAMPSQSNRRAKEWWIWSNLAAPVKVLIGILFVLIFVGIVAIPAYISLGIQHYPQSTGSGPSTPPTNNKTSTNNPSTSLKFKLPNSLQASDIHIDSISKTLFISHKRNSSDPSDQHNLIAQFNTSTSSIINIYNTTALDSRITLDYLEASSNTFTVVTVPISNAQTSTEVRYLVAVMTSPNDTTTSAGTGTGATPAGTTALYMGLWDISTPSSSSATKPNSPILAIINRPPLPANQPVLLRIDGIQSQSAGPLYIYPAPSVSTSTTPNQTYLYISD